MITVEEIMDSLETNRPLYLGPDKAARPCRRGPGRDESHDRAWTVLRYLEKRQHVTGAAQDAVASRAGKMLTGRA